MATEKQKAAARENIKKAQTTSANRAPAKHARNEFARFDQVEDVSDAERDRAWKQIEKAAEKYDVEMEATDWREMMSDDKTR